MTANRQRLLKPQRLPFRHSPGERRPAIILSPAGESSVTRPLTRAAPRPRIPAVEKNAFQLDAEVLANASAGNRYTRMVLAAPEIAARAQPGQFVNLRVTRGLDP